MSAQLAIGFIAVLVLNCASPAWAVPDGAGRVRVGQHLVREEPGVRSGLFIAPNEARGYVFNKLLKGRSRQGALLSIGTFRSVQDSARMRSNQASPRFKTFMLDYDQQATEFNRALIDALKQAPDRHALLAMLHGMRPRSPATMTGPQSASARLRADRDYLAELAAHANAQEVAAFNGVQADLSQVEESAVHATISNLPHLRYMLATLTKNHRQWQSSLFGSDTLFGLAKRQAEKGVFVPLNGSLSGHETLTDLSLALRKRRQKVSVIDLSNTLEYMDANGAAAPITAVARNLRALPLAKDALVLFTSASSTSHARGSQNFWGAPNAEELPWAYYAVRARDLLRAEAVGLFARDEGYRQQGFRNFLELAIRHTTAPAGSPLVEPGAGFAAAIEAAATAGAKPQR